MPLLLPVCCASACAAAGQLRSKGSKQPHTTLYLALPLADVQRLQELPSDDARLSALDVDLDVKLTGRPLNPEVLQLLGAIARDRQQRGLFTGQLPESHTLTVAPPAPAAHGEEGRESSGAERGEGGGGAASGDAAAGGSVEDGSGGDSAESDDYIAFV